MRIGASRQKYSPWLIVHFGKTETISADEQVEPWEPPPEPVRYSYDEYVSGSSGGPILDYWWKMRTASSEINYGGRGSATATLSLIATAGFSASLTLVTQNTVDGLAINYNGGGNTNYRTNLLWPIDISLTIVSTAISVGGWYDFSANTNNGVEDQQRIFTSNLGGLQGLYRGFYLYIPFIPTGGLNVIFTLGGLPSGVNSNRRYTTPSISWNSKKLIVATLTLANTSLSFSIASGYRYAMCNIDNLVSGLKVYIDGVEQSLSIATTGTGTSCVIGVPAASDFSGWRGMAFETPGDLIGAEAFGKRDELFVHYDILTPVQVAEMYTRGTTIYGTP